MKKSVKKGLWQLAGLLLLILLMVLVWRWWTGADPVPEYVTAEVTREDIEELVTAIGKLEPRDYVDVGAQVSGQLTALHVQVGDRVEQGQLLAEIDASVQQSRVDAGRADLDALAAQLQQQRAQLQLSELQFQRQQRLRDAGATSDDAYQSARASLAVTRAQIDVLEAQLRQRRSSVAGDQASLDFARIYAPRDGTIVSLEAREGQTLNANQTAPLLMRIADLSAMTVSTQVSEADVGRLQPGMPVYFSTLGNNQRYHSRLDQLLPTPEEFNNVVLYTARFTVDNPAGALMSGMTAQVFFVVQRAEQSLAVPVAALQKGPQGSQVQVLDSQGKPQWRPVTAGVSNRVVVAVTGDLAEGDQVVIGGRAAPRQSNELERVRRRGLY